MELWRPSWRTVADGSVIWIRYTHNQWMRARVIYGTKRLADVSPLDGSVKRVFPVAWDETRFTPPADALIAGEEQHTASGYCPVCHRSRCRACEVAA